MPGYIMHLCEGKYIADKLHITRDSRSRLLNDFLLGCILPDAVHDKACTHFRPEWQRDLITKYPDIRHLLSIYSIDNMTPADLGILAHLILDTAYVKEFWPKYFRFENIYNEPTCISNDIDHIRMSGLSMQSEGMCIPFKDFFSDRFFYGDYNLTNPLFVRDFSPVIPEISTPDISIYECRCFSPGRLEADMKAFTSISPDTGIFATNVFPYNDLKSFIISQADFFIQILDDISFLIRS